MPVHLYGQACDMDGIMKIAKNIIYMLLRIMRKLIWQNGMVK